MFTAADAKITMYKNELSEQGQRELDTIFENIHTCASNGEDTIYLLVQAQKHLLPYSNCCSLDDVDNIVKILLLCGYGVKCPISKREVGQNEVWHYLDIDW